MSEKIKFIQELKTLITELLNIEFSCISYSEDYEKGCVDTLKHIQNIIEKLGDKKYA